MKLPISKTDKGCLHVDAREKNGLEFWLIRINDASDGRNLVNLYACDDCLSEAESAAREFSELPGVVADEPEYGSWRLRRFVN